MRQTEAVRDFEVELHCTSLSVTVSFPCGKDPLVVAPAGSLQQVSMVCVLPEMLAEIRDLIVSPQLSDILERTPESGPNILNTFPKGYKMAQ